MVQIDEAHLNRRKAGKLTRAARPERDQVWLWGACLQGKAGHFYYKVLDHPEDACDGKPRGTQEILKCLRQLNIKRKTILVTDGWRSTAAAIKLLRKEKGWTAEDLHQEVVNHSAGEIVNKNGFTTNHIEGTWSSLKRWVRKRYGGRLPSHSDRSRWGRLVAEFHWRKLKSAGNSHDWGHTEQVKISSAMAALRASSV